MSTAPTRLRQARPAIYWACFVVYLPLCGLACASPPPATTLNEQADARPTDELISVVIETDRGPAPFRAEIVDTPADRQKGLMFRTELPEATGMLFVFPAESQQSFWMRNTLIPLDIIFIRADKTILGIVENAAPKTETPRSVPGQSQYVLELIGGSAGRYRISAGQSVKFYTIIPEQ
jgi:uncharacterized protein